MITIIFIFATISIQVIGISSIPKTLTYTETQELEKDVEEFTRKVPTTLEKQRNSQVSLDKKFGPPTITNDGVTKAKEIELDDPFTNMGNELSDAISKGTDMLDMTDDGTTTFKNSDMYTDAMVAAGQDPMELKSGIKEKVQDTIENGPKKPEKVVKKEEIAQIAATGQSYENIENVINDV